jgi:tetratricopeptide (TPR) repeat protein
LDDSNADALALLSSVDWVQGRFDQAVADAERAVDINPNSAADYEALSDALINAVRSEAALRAAEKAMRLDPIRQDFYAYCAGLACFQLGRYQEAINLLKRSLTARPNNLVAHLGIAASYVELGRDQDARAEAAEIERISPNYAVASWPRVKDEAASKRFVSDLRKAGLK